MRGHIRVVHDAPLTERERAAETLFYEEIQRVVDRSSRHSRQLSVDGLEDLVGRGVPVCVQDGRCDRQPLSGGLDRVRLQLCSDVLVHGV